jgi:hypothetical protein
LSYPTSVAVVEEPAVIVEGVRVTIRLYKLPALTVSVAVPWILPTVAVIVQIPETWEV